MRPIPHTNMILVKTEIDLVRTLKFLVTVTPDILNIVVENTSTKQNKSKVQF